IPHQHTQRAELWQPTGDPQQRPPLGGGELPLHEQVAVREQLSDLALDPLLAPGAAPRRAASVPGRPRGSFGAVAGSRLRSWATAGGTGLTTSGRTWRVQTRWGTSPKTATIGSG